MNKWLKNKNILNYVIRQGQSCDYLKTYFKNDLEPLLDIEGKKLLNKLLSCHARQKDDIIFIIKELPETDRTSYYFDSMIGKNTDPKILLVIQYISYLRGKKRYALLKDFESEENMKFINMWIHFYVDATSNSRYTVEYLINKYGIKIFLTIWKYKIKEFFLIRKINRYNNSIYG